MLSCSIHEVHCGYGGWWSWECWNIIRSSWTQINEVLGVAYDGKNEVGLCKKYSPDAVMMDLSMPNFDGLYGLENILKLDSNAKVIMHTVNSKYESVEKLNDSGVSVIAVNHLIQII